MFLWARYVTSKFDSIQKFAHDIEERENERRCRHVRTTSGTSTGLNFRRTNKMREVPWRVTSDTSLRLLLMNKMKASSLQITSA